MIEVSKVFVDENHSCRIDFSKALWATDQLNSIFHQAKLSILHDVDFVAEIEDAILLVEYKNANLPNAANPAAFKPTEDTKINNVARKYYDSLLFLQVLQRGVHKKKKYIYVLECAKGDGFLRRRVRELVAARLPFLLQQQTAVAESLIDSVEVLSVAEWNAQYTQFPMMLI